MGLWDIGDFPGQAGCRISRNVLPIVSNLPALYGLLPGHAGQQRTLPGPVGAEDAKDFRRLQRKRNAIQDLMMAVTITDVMERDVHYQLTFPFNMK